MGQTPHNPAKRLQQLMQAERFSEAVVIARKIAQSDDHDHETFFLAGLALLKQEQTALASDLLKKAHEQSPRNDKYLGWLARAYHQMNLATEAVAATSELTQRTPEEAEHHRLLGESLYLAQKTEAARQCFARTLEINPQSADAALRLIETTRYSQPTQEAERFAHTLEKQFPNDPRIKVEAAAALIGSDREKAVTWLTHALYNETSVSVALEVILASGVEETMPLALERAALWLDADTTSQSEGLRLRFATGNIRHHLKQFDRAFDDLERANREARQVKKERGHLWDRKNDDKRINLTIDCFPREKIEQANHGKSRGITLPLWIMGLPRSGKSLLARILQNHSDIGGGSESTPISLLVRNIEQRTKRSYMDILRQCDTRIQAKMGLQYLKNLQGQDLWYKIDTNPIHLPYLGLVAASIPQARFIFIQRDSMDNAYSIFAKFFPALNGWDTDLTDIAHYMHSSYRLQAFWADALMDRALFVSYESLVTNEQETSRRIIDFLGLEWDSGVARSEETTRLLTPGLDDAQQTRLDNRFIGIAQPYRDKLRPFLETMEKLEPGTSQQNTLQ